jgi:hypothetical protein
MKTFIYGIITKDDFINRIKDRKTKGNPHGLKREPNDH